MNEAGLTTAAAWLLKALSVVGLVIGLVFSLLVLLYLCSLLFRPKHIKAIVNAGPPRNIRAKLGFLSNQIEANTEIDEQRDQQIRALAEAVRKLRERQGELERILMAASVHLQLTGGEHAYDDPT